MKNLLLASGITVFTCSALMLGTTFAWFSDSIVNRGNIIEAGSYEAQEAEETETLSIRGASAATSQELYEAVEKAGEEKAVINLGGNISLDASLVISEGQDITIDLKGYSLTASSEDGAAAVILNEGNLSVNDSAGGGSIVMQFEKPPAPEDGALCAVENKGVLNINGGLTALSCSELPQEDADYENTRAAAVISLSSERAAAVNVTGGTVDGGAFSGVMTVLEKPAEADPETEHDSLLKITDGEIKGGTYGRAVWISNSEGTDASFLMDMTGGRVLAVAAALQTDNLYDGDETNVRISIQGGTLESSGEGNAQTVRLNLARESNTQLDIGSGLLKNTGQGALYGVGSGGSWQDDNER